MKLIVVHQVLIAMAIALAALMGVRGAVRFARGGGAVEIAIAAFAVVTCAALTVYLRKVRARYLAHQGRLVRSRDDQDRVKPDAP